METHLTDTIKDGSKMMSGEWWDKTLRDTEGSGNGDNTEKDISKPRKRKKRLIWQMENRHWSLFVGQLACYITLPK